MGILDEGILNGFEALYLRGMVSTDDRAVHGVNQKLEGVTSPPGSPLIGEVSDGSEHLFQ